MATVPEEIDAALRHLVEMGMIQKTEEGFVFDPAKV